MCGILGLFSPAGVEGYGNMLQKANDLVSYRGPDSAGFVLLSTKPADNHKPVQAERMPCEADLGSADLVLAHRRLAIIDLSPSGHQPMSSSDSTNWITYNGEIYNYPELRKELEANGHSFRSHSDTEVILRAYEEWGEACVNRFNGMWAFALADLRQQKLFCSRDRFGVKPFHYFSDGKRFAFGSEIKQLLCFSFVPRLINKGTVYEYLAYQVLEHSDQTFFAGISNLLPGHNLTVDFKSASVRTDPFYSPRFSIDYRMSETEAAERFRDLLEDAVRIRLRSDVQVGSCLSGGLDSSSIVCLMQRLLRNGAQGDVQHTFSSHFSEEEANELEYMEEVVRSTGVRAHYTYPTPDDFSHDLDRLVWHQEEPFGSTSIFAQWSVFKSVHEHGVKVMLDGQGADEVLGGYQPLGYYFLSDLLAKQQILKYLKESWYQWRIQAKPVAVLASQPLALLMPQPLKPLLGRMKRTMTQGLPPVHSWLDQGFARGRAEKAAYLSNQANRAFDRSEVFNNTLFQLTFFNNLQALLKYEDRNSMAFSVEGRLPFLDYRLVEFAFTMPSTFKIRGGYTKRVLRDSMEGILPGKIQWRVSKLGFATPERVWQNTSLRPLIEEALRDKRLSSFVMPRKARDFLSALDKSTHRDFTPWLWVNLSLWMKAYGLEP